MYNCQFGGFVCLWWRNRLRSNFIKTTVMSELWPVNSGALMPLEVSSITLYCFLAFKYVPSSSSFPWQASDSASHPLYKGFGLLSGHFANILVLATCLASSDPTYFYTSTNQGTRYGVTLPLCLYFCSLGSTWEHSPSLVSSKRNLCLRFNVVIPV